MGGLAKLREVMIWRPVGDAASELIFSVQCCLDIQLLPVLGQERLCMYSERCDLETTNVAE